MSFPIQVGHTRVPSLQTLASSVINHHNVAPQIATYMSHSTHQLYELVVPLLSSTPLHALFREAFNVEDEARYSFYYLFIREKIKVAQIPISVDESENRVKFRENSTDYIFDLPEKSHYAAKLALFLFNLQPPIVEKYEPINPKTIMALRSFREKLASGEMKSTDEILQKIKAKNNELNELIQQKLKRVEYDFLLSLREKHRGKDVFHYIQREIEERDKLHQSK